jgi:extradiol dioxygenase family protein
MLLTPFHLAIKVNDLAAASEFYGELLGCPRGPLEFKAFNDIERQLFET